MCILPFHVKNGGCERRYPWTGRQAGHGRQAVHSCIQLLVNHSFFSIHAFIQLKVLKDKIDFNVIDKNEAVIKRNMQIVT